MNITDVRIKLMEEPGDRLLAFCSITLARCFVVRDLKLIDGENGRFVAMPSRKLTARCPKCRSKNMLRARFCDQCGTALEPSEGAEVAGSRRPKLYADIAHPISASCRRQVEQAVAEAYERELEASRQPGYVCRYEDYGEEGFAKEAATLGNKFAGSANGSMSGVANGVTNGVTGGPTNGATTHAASVARGGSRRPS